MPIRKAKPADIAAIVELGMDALQKDAYSNMVISREKVEAVARECVSSAKNFAWVAEKDGVVGGAVCALVHECIFHAHQQASVVQFHCRIPGEGVKLLREFLRWSRVRSVIKMRVFTLEHNADPRIGKLLVRLGLKTVLPVYLET